MRSGAVREAVFRHCDRLLPPGATVLVAVSGGADSLALLHLLSERSTSRSWSLVVAHVNHGQDPTIDDVAVTALAEVTATLGLPFVWTALDLPPGSSEEVLRTARYTFLAATARSSGATHVAVAHHADDQAETFLLRLLRGSVAGLGAMAPTRPIDSQIPTVTLIRPLLGVRRADLQAVCREAGLEPIEDPSNANRRFDRNALRHGILPALQARWPGLVPTVTRTAQLLQEDDAFLMQLAAATLQQLPAPPAPVPTAPLQDLPGPVLRRVLRGVIAERTGRLPDSAALERATAVVTGTAVSADLARGWRLTRQGGWLSLEERLAGSMHPVLPVTWSDGTEVSLAPWPYRSRLDRVDRPVATEPLTCCLPDGWQVRKLVWRGVLPGDRLPTASGHLRVGEILRQQGVPADQRSGVLVLAEGSTVFWLVGLRHGLVPQPGAPGQGCWRLQLTPAGR